MLTVCVQYRWTEVGPENVAEYMVCPDVDGALVGASLEAVLLALLDPLLNNFT